MRSASKSSFVVCGLPGSGKTTFLAALWHIVQSREINTCLALKSLAYGDYGYVNGIRKRWQQGFRQQRTVGEAYTVGIDLKDAAGNEVQVLFPDHSGETYDGLWEKRTCSEGVAAHLRNRRGTLLFLRSQGVKRPQPLSEIIATEEEMQMALEGNMGSNVSTSPRLAEDSGRDWTPKYAPDQVKVVDILQILSSQMRTGWNEKVAIFVSAWDVVDPKFTPTTFVKSEFPLLYQYLVNAVHCFDVRIYGISAQGAEYVTEDDSGEPPHELQELLNLESASARIKLVYEGSPTADLTEPLSWLMK